MLDDFDDYAFLNQVNKIILHFSNSPEGMAYSPVCTGLDYAVGALTGLCAM